jgi:Domain of unknown function (DUF4338)
MVCPGLMLALHRSGHIEYPPRRRASPNPLANRQRPHAVEIDRTPVCSSLRELGPLRFCQVRRTPQEPLFNWLIESEHYLAYTHPVGESLKFKVLAGSQPVVLFAWSLAPRHFGLRDRYIGWPREVRQRNVRHVAYNTRYLIPSWIQVPHLASHLLSLLTRMLGEEWQKVYGHQVYFAETFVDTTRHRGTCYRAANWVFMGQTTGRGKDDHTNKPNRSLKDVLGLALVEDFRGRLLNA